MVKMGARVWPWLLVAAVIAAAAAPAAVSEEGAESVLDTMNPLSTINIQAALVVMDAGSIIQASPVLLGENGEDFAWVTVNFSTPKPTSGDWIGVFSPANFNTHGVNAEGQAQGITSSPIKYKLIDQLSPSYIYSGSGNTSFHLINQRQDFAFGLFTGGKDNPRLIAVSNTIAFANPLAPVFPRLAQGKEWNEMTVTWTSGYNITISYPFVEWSMKGAQYPTRTPAGTLTFAQWQMCGSASLYGGGWRDPGYIHTASLKELWPNREYVYQIGQELLDGSIVWGKSSTFRASPYPGQESVQRVVVFGDMGTVGWDGSSELQKKYYPGAASVVARLARDLPNYDMLFHIGDLSYANGHIGYWDMFTAQIEPFASKVPYMVASGNHERAFHDTGAFYDTDDSFGECGIPAETYFYVPAENRDKFWYKTDYGMFRFCVADTEHDWRPGTEQYKFLENCFATVDRKYQPWLIFLAHRPLGYSSNHFYGVEGEFSEPMGRSIQLLWQKYRVDLAIYGHVHNYERTCPVYESKCVHNPSPNKDPHDPLPRWYNGTSSGTIHIVAGTGGASLVPFNDGDPRRWSVYRNNMHFGYVKLTASFHYLLQVEFVRSDDGSVLDYFGINKNYRDIVACVVDSCPTHTVAENNRH